MHKNRTECKPVNIWTRAAISDKNRIHLIPEVNRRDQVAPEHQFRRARTEWKQLTKITMTKFKFVSYIRSNARFAFRMCTACGLHLGQKRRTDVWPNEAASNNFTDILIRLEINWWRNVSSATQFQWCTRWWTIP